MQSREINPSSPPRSPSHSTVSPPRVVDIDAIELEKENIQPIRQGRSAQALSRLFASQPEERAQELARQRQEFDDELQRIDQAVDPLDVYSRYVSWTTRNYPQSSGQGHHSRLLPLLEQAIKQFQDKTSYKNDPRFVKILILYSEMADLPEDVFNFMETKNIGVEIALYYEAYAEYLETKEDFDKARDIYLLGINRTARPQGLLRNRLHEFQHRVQIHQEKLEIEALEASATFAIAEPTNRRVLGAKISRSESVHSNATVHGHVALGSGASSSSSIASTRPSSSSSSSTQQRPNARLMVYSDSNQPASSSSRTKQGQENASWKDLGTQQVRRKENIREPTSWEGARLTAKDSFTRRPHPKLEVFKDPEGTTLPQPDARIKKQLPETPSQKLERLMFDFERTYANNDEFSPEELRARIPRYTYNPVVTDIESHESCNDDQNMSQLLSDELHLASCPNPRPPTFLIKPLLPTSSNDDERQLFGPTRCMASSSPTIHTKYASEEMNKIFSDRSRARVSIDSEWSLEDSLEGDADQIDSYKRAYSTPIDLPASSREYLENEIENEYDDDDDEGGDGRTENFIRRLERGFESTITQDIEALKRKRAAEAGFEDMDSRRLSLRAGKKQSRLELGRTQDYSDITIAIRQRTEQQQPQQQSQSDVIEWRQSLFGQGSRASFEAGRLSSGSGSGSAGHVADSSAQPRHALSSKRSRAFQVFQDDAENLDVELNVPMLEDEAPPAFLDHSEPL